MITIQTDTGELQGHDFISRLFCGTVNWFGHLMSDIAGSSGGRGNANGGRGSGIVIPFYELFGLCDFGSFQVGENRNTLAVLATKAFQDGYDARWGLTMAIPVVLCDLSIRFIWSVRRFFGDKKQLSECIPSDKQPDLRMMVLVGNGTLCIVDGVDAAVRSGGNMLVFFMHLNLIAWYKLVKRVLAELIIRYDLSYADLAVYIEKINQELNQQLQVLRAIDYVMHSISPPTNFCIASRVLSSSSSFVSSIGRSARTLIFSSFIVCLQIKTGQSTRTVLQKVKGSVRRHSPVDNYFFLTIQRFLKNAMP